MSFKKTTISEFNFAVVVFFYFIYIKNIVVYYFAKYNFVKIAKYFAFRFDKVKNSVNLWANKN